MTGTRGDFYEFTMSHARLTIVRTLLEASGYAANDSVLCQAMEALGLPVTRDQLRTQLGWLEEQGLVSLTRPADTVIVARVTERGADVAAGKAHVPGVARPSPGR